VIRALLAKGFTGEQIAEIAECIGDEHKAKIREQTRIRVRNHRARNAVTRYNGKAQQDQRPCNANETGTLFAQEESYLLSQRVSKKDSPAWNFAAFYEAYPRKRDKLEAERAFRKVERSGLTTFEALLQAVQRIDRKELKFVPYPATWLNRGGYLDEASKNPSASSGYADHWRAQHGALEEQLRRGWG